MNTNYPAMYLVAGIYHFRYTTQDGRRLRQSTGFSKKADAKKFVQEFVDKLRAGVDLSKTVRDVLELYQDPETNPKRKEASITNSFYSERYALHTARHAKDLEKVLDKRMRGFLDKPICQIYRYQIKEAAIAIVGECGACNKSAKLYKLLKSLFGQAADDGLIQANVAAGLPDIKHQTTRRGAIPAQDIRLVLSHPEIFPNAQARRLFTIMATTGMRRSEVLAMGPDQLKGDVLVIDRAYKDDSLKVIGSPKWGKERVIPLSRLALDAVKETFSEGSGPEPVRVSSRTLSIWFNQIREHAVRLDLQRPEVWKELTPHVLRHSLNTNLLLSGLSQILVAEYLSWEHQGINSVQEGYTHLYAENLRIIIEKIDIMYGYEERQCDLNVIS